MYKLTEKDKLVNEALKALDEHDTIECEYFTKIENDTTIISVKKKCAIVIGVILLWLGCWKLTDIIFEVFEVIFDK